MAMENLKKVGKTEVHLEKSSARFETRQVRVFTKGIIRISGFAMTVLMEGYDLLITDVKTTESKDSRLLMRMYRWFQYAPNMFTEFEVTGEELLVLISWLNKRISHCEAERGSQKFNAETMVDMKLLLLELRELLYSKENAV
jgi:hypothetical protein